MVSVSGHDVPPEGGLQADIGPSESGFNFPAGLKTLVGETMLGNLLRLATVTWSRKSVEEFFKSVELGLGCPISTNLFEK